jgi:hypothetical protein
MVRRRPEALAPINDTLMLRAQVGVVISFASAFERLALIDWGLYRAHEPLSALETMEDAA